MTHLVTFFSEMKTVVLIFILFAFAAAQRNATNGSTISKQPTPTKGHLTTTQQLTLDNSTASNKDSFVAKQKSNHTATTKLSTTKMQQNSTTTKVTSTTSKFNSTATELSNRTNSVSTTTKPYPKATNSGANATNANATKTETVKTSATTTISGTTKPPSYEAKPSMQTTKKESTTKTHSTKKESTTNTHSTTNHSIAKSSPKLPSKSVNSESLPATKKQSEAESTKPPSYKAKPSLQTTTKLSPKAATSSSKSSPQSLSKTSDSSFESWKAKYSKVYASAALESQAKKIYDLNVAKISKQNSAPKSSFKLEANYNADMTEKQIRKFREGFKVANPKTVSNATKTSKFAKKFVQSQKPSSITKSQSYANNKSATLDYTRFVARRPSNFAKFLLSQPDECS